MSNKEELALQVGMQFEEAIELFSEETLSSMQLVHIVGGESTSNVNCAGANCYLFCSNTGNCAPGCGVTTVEPE